MARTKLPEGERKTPFTISVKESVLNNYLDLVGGSTSARLDLEKYINRRVKRRVKPGR